MGLFRWRESRAPLHGLVSPKKAAPSETAPQDSLSHRERVRVRGVVFWSRAAALPCCRAALPRCRAALPCFASPSPSHRFAAGPPSPAGRGLNRPPPWTRFAGFRTRTPVAPVAWGCFAATGKPRPDAPGPESGGPLHGVDPLERIAGPGSWGCSPEKSICPNAPLEPDTPRPEHVEGLASVI